MEAEVFHLGPWLSFEHLEENLNLDELYLLISTKRDGEYTQQKFAAALKGIDLDEQRKEQNSTFEDIKSRADAHLAGMSEDEMFYTAVGIEFDED